MSVDFPDRINEEETCCIPGRVQFRHDPRLLLPYDIYYTPEQVSSLPLFQKCPFNYLLQNAAVISAIESETLLITAGSVDYFIFLYL